MKPSLDEIREVIAARRRRKQSTAAWEAKLQAAIVARLKQETRAARAAGRTRHENV